MLIRRAMTILMLTTLLALTASAATKPAAHIDLHQRIGAIHIVKKQGQRFVQITAHGQTELLTPKQYIHAVQQQQQKRRSDVLFLVFNITTWVGVLWVVFGLLGQVMFTGRMVVQWLVSEKNKRSVVPVAFWWMSIVGASMLLIYFIWRKDIVGSLGQSTGFAIYARNLWLIYRKGPHSVAATSDPAPEAELSDG